MKRAFRTTFLMLLAAACTAAAAAYYYPWPDFDVTSDRIDEPLFTDFDLEQVRSIKILSFNDDRNELESIELRRKADKWVFPNKGNFVATGAPLIAAVRGSLNERKVREFMSDKEEDHIKYGVIDPVRHGSAIRSSLGTKLVLEDRQGQVVASLIVGKKVKSDSQTAQRFVRIPEQPHVFVIDYDSRILTTDFQNWNDANLLQLATRNNPSGGQPVDVRINSYRINDIKKPTEVEKFYRAGFMMKGQQLGFDAIEVPTSDGWKKVAPNETQQKDLAQWAQVVAQIPAVDVKRKGKKLNSALRIPKKDTPDSAFAELENYGFRKVGFRDYVGIGGEFSIVLSNGVRYHLYVGGFNNESTKSSSSALARYLMITADVYSPSFPEIEKSDDAEDKKYLRAVEKRKQKLTQATQLANDLNRLHADWYYIVSDEVLSKLIPIVSFESEVKTESTAGEESTDGEASAEESKGEDEVENEGESGDKSEND